MPWVLSAKSESTLGGAGGPIAAIRRTERRIESNDVAILTGHHRASFDTVRLWSEPNVTVLSGLRRSRPARLHQMW